jgi:hypothetical protein
LGKNQSTMVHFRFENESSAGLPMFPQQKRRRADRPAGFGSAATSIAAQVGIGFDALSAYRL